MLGEVARAIGDRLQVPGKSRVTVSGALSDGKSERQITYSWQFPGIFRIEDTKGGLIQFNGDRLNVNAIAAQANDSASLVQSLVGDQIETLLWSIAESGGIRFLGGHFRLDDGKAANYNGPLVNYYEQILPVRAKGNLHTSEIRRLLAVDSTTMLLRFVRYFTLGKNDVSMETRFNSWRRIGDQWFPGEIVRLDAGKETFRFQLSRAEVGDKLSTFAFGEVIP